MRPPWLMPLALLLVLPGAFAQGPEIMIHAVDQQGTRAFLPAETTVAPGEPVAVMAYGNEIHALRAVDGSFQTGALNPNDETFETTFQAPPEPGRYPFYCPYHADASTPPGTGMTGVLVVESVAAPASPTSPPPGRNETPALPLAGALGAFVLAGLAFARRR